MNMSVLVGQTGIIFSHTCTCRIFFSFLRLKAFHSFGRAYSDSNRITRSKSIILHLES